MKEKQKWSIYVLLNKRNNKRYVGVTRKTVEQRFRYHCYSARYGSQSLVHKAIRKYGSDSFELYVLEENTELEKEKYWIEKLNPEYNLTKGGEGGDTSHSPAYKQAMLVRNQTGANNGMFGLLGENNPNFGKKRTKEQRDKLKQGLKKSWTAERKKKHQLCFVSHTSKKITLNGVTYNSIAEASRVNGKSEYFVKKEGRIVIQ